jgi:hypothetical protein
MRRKLPELRVYVFGARCVWRLVAAPMEKSDLMTLFNEPLHDERADEPSPAQNENPTHHTASVLSQRAVIVAL